MRLRSFRITGLFDRLDIEMRFDDNKLVLVGENGTGKSTSLRIFYHFLTRQWEKLLADPFKAIEIAFSSDHAPGRATITRENLSVALARMGSSPSLDSDLSGPETLAFVRELLDGGPFYPTTERLYRLLGREGDTLPEKHRRALVASAISTRYYERGGKGGKGKKTIQRADQDFRHIRNLLDRHVEVQFLFLPTYRRIERDLKYLFPDLQLEPKRQSSGTAKMGVRAGHYTELIQFGMNDVEASFTLAMQRLDKELRADLSRLTGEYLHDVLHSAHTRDQDYVSQLSDSEGSLDTVLSKVDENILKPADREELRQLTEEIRLTRGIPPGKEVAAHFLSKLVGVYDRQRDRERQVEMLTSLCNKYLSGKELRYDPVEFRLHFVLTSERAEEEVAGGRDNGLSTGLLSSGEKQIVSLFTHLLLSQLARDGSGEDPKYFVIIDEPELSISVEWQRMLLPDVLATGLCEGLLAVTHSPFVFDNELDRYAHSMAEFVEPGKPRVPPRPPHA